MPEGGAQAILCADASRRENVVTVFLMARNVHQTDASSR